jgi:peptidyl-prolyl cis-trans isomerase A (cyclophilin A)
MTRSVIAAVLAAAIISGAASASGGPSLLDPSSLNARAPATFSARFKTTKGSFVVKVKRSWAPKGADRFYNLVLNHFYDNQPLFRVLPGFVVQWGISGVPAIAKAWQFAYIKDDPKTHHDAKATIEFANAGANTRTTQVFVNLVSNYRVLKGYPGFSPFGTITSGFASVLKQLYHGYGEGPSNNQALLTKLGAPWVHKRYPKLDWIKTARLVH